MEAPESKLNSLKARSEFAISLRDTAGAKIKLNVKQTVCDHDHFQSKVSDMASSYISGRSALFRPRLISASPLDICFSSGPASSSSNAQHPWPYTGVRPSASDLTVGLDYQHWRVEVETPVGNPTRDQIIDSYIDILATVT
ncbi:hypothetical protein AgCh_030398 [Apium graveolens]